MCLDLPQGHAIPFPLGFPSQMRTQSGFDISVVWECRAAFRIRTVVTNSDLVQAFYADVVPPAAPVAQPNEEWRFQLSTNTNK